jgi:endonuclease V-like protein UPF0215 family
LTPQKIRHVKREIRVLGVAAASVPDGYSIVGVVYRGCRWLDGVLHTRSGDDLTHSVADMLIASPHAGQVRVILLSRVNIPPDANIDLARLNMETGKPVIMVKEDITYAHGHSKPVFLAEGLGRWTAEAVLRASSRPGEIPEVLRVASMTLSALIDAENA